MKISKILTIIIVLFMVVGCTKKASIKNTSYDEIMRKINNNETFILALINNEDKEYKRFNNNLKTIVKDYNINVSYLNVNNLNTTQLEEIKAIVNYEDTPILVYIKEGIEDNPNNRIIGDISIDRMIEIFKSAGYID